MDAASQCLLLQQLQWQLDIHVQKQNGHDRSISFLRYIEREVTMREISGLASAIRNTVATMRKAHADALDNLNREVTASKVNLDKVNAFTEELKAANLEMEASLGDTGSNFPTSVILPEQSPDLNGVTLNKG